MNLNDLLKDPVALAEHLKNLGAENLTAVDQVFKAAISAAQVAAEKEKEEAKKAAIRDELKKIEEQLATNDSGITITDLFNAATEDGLIKPKKVAKAKTHAHDSERKAKRPKPQFKIDVDGETTYWAGRGRAPLVFVAIKEEGRLEEYRMTQEEVDAYVAANPEMGF